MNRFLRLVVGVDGQWQVCMSSFFFAVFTMLLKFTQCLSLSKIQTSVEKVGRKWICALTNAWHKNALCLSNETVQLTNRLCCTCSCRSNSHHIYSNHWHAVIAWRKIWWWLKGLTAPPNCAPGNVYIVSIHGRPTLKSGLVLCDDSPGAMTCFHRVHWILEAIDLMIK